MTVDPSRDLSVASRRRGVAGVVAGVLVAGVLATACQGQPSGGVPPAPVSGGDGAGSPSGPGDAHVALDVRLERLTGPRPAVSASPRSPFSFERAPAVRAPASLGGPGEAPPPVATYRPPPEPPFRMIGLVEGDVGRIAVLTDGEVVVHGRPGDIVEGRYRIVRVEPTLVEIEHLESGRREQLRLPEP